MDLTKGTLTVTTPNTQVTQSGGTIDIVGKGVICTLNGGTDKIIINGNAPGVDISGGTNPLEAHLKVMVNGVAGGTINTMGNSITIDPATKSAIFEETINFNCNAYGSNAGTIIFNMADKGSIVSAGVISGTLDFTSLSFLQNSKGVSFNDGMGPGGIAINPAHSGGILDNGVLPTLEIDKLNPLKDIHLTQTSLTLDFLHGKSVTLNNVSMNDPAQFKAVQTANGSLFLSEASVPAGKAITIIHS